MWGDGEMSGVHANSAVIVVVAAILGLAAVLFLIRMAIGPTLADRVVALNGLTVVGMVYLALNALTSDRNSYLSVLVVLSVVGFVGTAMIARFMRGRGPS